MSVAQTKFKKSFYHLKSPHGIMVKNLHPKNSAPSNSKTEVSLKNIHVNTIAWSTLIAGLEIYTGNFLTVIGGLNVVLTF